MYVFLWFWFMLLAVITGVSIIFRLAAFQPIYDTEPFRYLCVQSHPLLMQTVNTNSFRIVPVCVPSVRKWGAYNMATIIDKFDFKFANRVTVSFFKDKMAMFFSQGSRGEERKRTEEMLGRCG